MSDPFIGEIRMFAGDFAPAGWALCNGQILQISQNQALFLLLGTTYGGDGQTTFGLPDLRGRTPLHAGQGANLSPRPLGQKTGTEDVTLTGAQLPRHSHTLQASTDTPGTGTAHSAVFAAAERMYGDELPGDLLDETTITASGSNQAHTNMMPFLGMNFIIALFGIFPSQN